MLRIYQSGSVAAAKSYYTKSLVPGDYYLGQDMTGTWHGKTAAMLGLSGKVEEQDFVSLCENRRPGNATAGGEQLNPCNREKS